MKCIAKWEKNEEGEWRWRCDHFLMSKAVSFSETRERCYHWKCKGRKPRHIPSNDLICENENCDNLKNGNPKYCSMRCRKRANDKAYRERKRAEREALVSIESNEPALVETKGKKVSAYLNGSLLSALESYCQDSGHGKSKVIQDALASWLGQK